MPARPGGCWPSGGDPHAAGLKERRPDLPRLYDAIIVGAGPAGALLGWLLATSGLNVLILEKQRLPRYKPCGGGLTRRALDLLPFDPAPVVEDLARRAVILLDGRPVFETLEREPVITLVMRDRFDHFLARRAEGAGATLKDGLAFRGLSGSFGRLEVATSAGTFHGRLIVGADGASSPTARALGLWSARRVFSALEAEVDFDRPETLDRFRGAVHFDFGLPPQGYAWLFPKAGHVSMGVLTRCMALKNLRPWFQAYLQTKGLDRETTVRSLRPHLIPWGSGSGGRLADDRGLLIGDAAGLTDPITGEGLYFAFREARLAAGVIREALDRGGAYLRRYEGLMRREFRIELAWARALAFLLYRMPGLRRRAFDIHGPGLGRRLLDVFAGRTSYRNLALRVLHPASLKALASPRSRRTI